MPCPWYRPEEGLKFLEAHGLAVRAVGGSFQPYLLQGLRYLCHIVEPIVEPACQHVHQALKASSAKLSSESGLSTGHCGQLRWIHKGVLHEKGGHTGQHHCMVQGRPQSREWKQSLVAAGILAYEGTLAGHWRPHASKLASSA